MMYNLPVTYENAFETGEIFGVTFTQDFGPVKAGDRFAWVDFKGVAGVIRCFDDRDHLIHEISVVLRAAT